MVMLRILALSAMILGAPSDSTKLPPFPTVIHTPLGDSRIEWMDSTFDCGGVRAIGCTTYKTRRIQVLRGMGVRETWVTIEHEKYHLKFHDLGIKFPSMAAEDEVCDKLAEARVYEMGVQD